MIYKNHNQGFAPIALLIALVAVLGVGGAGYGYVKYQEKQNTGKAIMPKTLPEQSNATLPEQNPHVSGTLPSQNPEVQGPSQLGSSLGANVSPFQVPPPADIQQQLILSPNMVAVSWNYPGALSEGSKSWGYGVFEWKNGGWNPLIDFDGIMADTITLSSLSQNAILVSNMQSGAGTSTDWSVLYKNGNVWASKSGDAVRNQALTQAGLVFMGYNSVSVVNGKIVEILPGYVTGDARCCPSGQGKTATYSFSGGAFALVSVQ
jgi:hypothetical protein